MTTKPRPPHHNHITRDIKSAGQCPACDNYWNQVAERDASKMPTDPRIEAAEMQIAAARSTNCSSKNLAIAALAAADAVDPLRRPGHRVEVLEDSWTLQHPPECRADMLACPLNEAMRQVGLNGVDNGTYDVELTAYGSLFFPDAVTL